MAYSLKKKRPLIQIDNESDYGLENDMSNPAAKKKRTSRERSSKKGKDDGLVFNNLTRIPRACQSDKSFPCLTKMWWKEMAQKDEFWNYFVESVGMAVIRKRFSVELNGSLTEKANEKKERIRADLDKRARKEQAKAGAVLLEAESGHHEERKSTLEIKQEYSDDGMAIDGNDSSEEDRNRGRTIDADCVEHRTATRNGKEDYITKTEATHSRNTSISITHTPVSREGTKAEDIARTVHVKVNEEKIIRESEEHAIVGDLSRGNKTKDDHDRKFDFWIQSPTTMAAETESGRETGVAPAKPRRPVENDNRQVQIKMEDGGPGRPIPTTSEISAMTKHPNTSSEQSSTPVSAICLKKEEKSKREKPRENARNKI